MTRLWTYHILDHHGTELDPIVCNQRLRIIRHLISFLLLGVSVLCGYLYFVQYYKWRDCFDEIGRCFDSQHGVVYLEQSGIAWIILALFAFGGFVFCMWLPRSRKSDWELFKSHLRFSQTVVSEHLV